LGVPGPPQVATPTIKSAEGNEFKCQHSLDHSLTRPATEF
jgi:hypothetical protein